MVRASSQRNLIPSLRITAVEDRVGHVPLLILHAHCLPFMVAVEARAEVNEPTLARPRPNVGRFGLDLPRYAERQAVSSSECQGVAVCSSEC